ncbi:phage tail protein, partial [Enterobacter hormaechei]|nr:phage tail protein [Enterobacter hormaechei]
MCCHSPNGLSFLTPHTQQKIVAPLNHGVKRMSDYHHGVEVIEINDGTRTISTVS